MDKQIYIEAICFSEKSAPSLGFGFYITEDEYNEERVSYNEEINIGISDSYRENWEEFEPGILKAKKMFDDGVYSGIKEALFAVFGHFKISFEIDGAAKDIDYQLMQAWEEEARTEEKTVCPDLGSVSFIKKHGSFIIVSFLL